MNDAIAPRLGARIEGQSTTFRVRSEHADLVELCLISSDGDRRDVGERRIAMQRRRDEPDLWEATELVGAGTLYGYRAHGGFDPVRGHYFNPAKLLVDPYARQVLEAPGFDAAAAQRMIAVAAAGGPDCRDSLLQAPWSVVCADRTPVPTSRPRVPASGRVVYEAHLGHLTRELDDVPERERGTFAALRSPRLVAHLLDIGVTTLELLPVMHWGNEIRLLARGQRNVWGYNPLAFFAPAPVYCAASGIDAQWDELAEAVRHLHEHGIEVVLDVVYNHTCEGAPDDPTYHLRGLDHASYYRMAGGRPADQSDVSGCGSTLDAGHRYVQDLVVDSLRHWVEMTDVDGFRFDLASALGRRPGFDPQHPLLQRIGADDLLGDRLLIAEPWDVGAGGYQLGGFTTPTRGEPWAEWNDSFRSAIRDFWRPGRGSRADLARALAGSSDIFGARGARSSIGYVTAHDGFTLRDLVSYNHRHNLPNGERGADGTQHNQSWNGGIEGDTGDPRINAIRLRRQKSMLGLLMLQLGTPMITAGDELDRTQSGNNNPYCLDGPELAVPWRDTPNAKALTLSLRTFAAIRQEHAELYDGRWLKAPGSPSDAHVVRWLDRAALPIADHQWHHDPAVLQAAFDASTGRGPLLMAFNGSETNVEITLPELEGVTTWRLRIDTSRHNAPGLSVAAGARISLAAFSLLVLAD